MLLMSGLLSSYVMVTVTAEDPASNRYDNANGISAGGGHGLFCRDFNPKRRRSCCPEHTCRAAIVCDLLRSIFLHRRAQFTWFADDLVTDSSLGSLHVL